MKELSETIELMQSDNYIDRFKAEYYQTKIRLDKLNKMMVKLEAGTLDFTPICSEDILNDQKYYMENYLHILEVRAEYENIEL